MAFQSLSILTQSFVQSDGIGKMIFLALFALSILTWYVLLSRVLFLQKTRLSAASIGKNILAKKERLLDIPLDQARSQNPYSKIYETFKVKTVEILDKNHYFAKQETVFLSRSDMELIECSVLTAINSQTKELERNLFVLSTIATLAPFLGLLGTVWGILITFSELQRGGTATSNQVMLGGLATALATTVLGLVIAIPALVGYNYLKNGIKHFFAEMDDFGSELLSTVELQYRKVEVE